MMIKQILKTMWSKMTNPLNIYDTFYPFMMYSKTFMYFHSTIVNQEVFVTKSDRIRLFLSIFTGVTMLFVIFFIQMPMVIEDKIFLYGTYFLVYSAIFSCLFAIIILHAKRVESHMCLNEIHKICLQLEKRHIELSYRKIQHFGYYLAILTFVLLIIGGIIYRFTVGIASTYFYLSLTWPASIYLQMLVHFLMLVNTVNVAYEGINETLLRLKYVSDRNFAVRELQTIKQMHQIMSKTIRYINSSLSIVVQPAFALIPFFLIYCCYVSIRIVMQGKYQSFLTMLHYTYAAFFFLVFFWLISHYGNKVRQRKEDLLKFVHDNIESQYDNYQVRQLLVNFRYQIQQEKSQIKFFSVPYDYTYLYAVS